MIAANDWNFYIQINNCFFWRIIINIFILNLCFEKYFKNELENQNFSNFMANNIIDLSK